MAVVFIPKLVAMLQSSYRQLTCNTGRRYLYKSSPLSKLPKSQQRSKMKMRSSQGRVKMPNVNVFRAMTVMELAETLGKDTDHVFECMLNWPTKIRIEDEHSALGEHAIRSICEQTGIRANFINRPMSSKKLEVDNDVYAQPAADPLICKPRPPVVTIMGHVDHGKTTLLDQLRKSNIVDQEFGGITQHIGAFSVKLDNGKSITFLDTPGHAAFSAMRGRGARMTDIIILVVAADDGVMPQTVESIDHAIKSNVPVIVAINKCDKPDANVEACKSSLLEHGIQLEEQGGDIMAVEISALKGINLDALREAVVTQAELLDLKSDYSGNVEGRIIETEIHPGRGKLASLLVQRGILKASKYLVAGEASAKVRGMFDEHNKPIKTASPGTAVQVIGWKELPLPGDEVLEVLTESRMKSVLNYRKQKSQENENEKVWSVIQEKKSQHDEVHQQQMELRRSSGYRTYRYIRNTIDAIRQESQEEVPQVPSLLLIVRGDVEGSLEAILSCLESYDAYHLCHLEVISSGIGAVTESDVDLAEAFDATVLAFNVDTPTKVDKLAASKRVVVHHHNIIYKMFDDIKEMLISKIPLSTEHKTLGEAVIQQVFVVKEKVNGKAKKIPVAGCKCIQGSLFRDKLFKLVRGTEVLHTGILFSLKHFKNEVPDIKEGMECGLALSDDSVDIQEGDTILCYEEIKVQPELEWTLPG